MKKQYTTETAYEGNTKVTFYENGSETYHNVVSDYKLDGYLEAKREDGWEEAYTHEQMEHATMMMKKAQDQFLWWQDYLEEIKANLIGGK